MNEDNENFPSDDPDILNIDFSSEDNPDQENSIEQILDSETELPERLDGFGPESKENFQKKNRPKTLDLNDPKTLNLGSSGRYGDRNRTGSGGSNASYGRGYSRDGARFGQDRYNQGRYGYQDRNSYGRFNQDRYSDRGGYNPYRSDSNNYNNSTSYEDDSAMQQAPSAPENSSESYSDSSSYNSRNSYGSYNNRYNNQPYNNRNYNNGYNNNYNDRYNNDRNGGGYNNNYSGYNNRQYGGYNKPYNEGGYNRPYRQSYSRYPYPNYNSDPLAMPDDVPRPPRKPKPYEVNPNDIDKELLMDDPLNLEDEPLSLAEELAEEINHGRQDEDEFDKIYKKLRESNFNNLADLQRLSMPELIEIARQENLEVADEEGAQRQDLIFRILKERIKLNGLIYGEGTLEILPDGFGFLRSSDYHYVSCPDDIYVSPSQIRRFGLKNGVTISGQIRPPKENERYFALLRIEAINFREPNELVRRVDFEDLTAIHPTQQIKMETTPDELNTRVTDLITPLGFGQRALIVSPPRAGKTILMQKMAKAALKNYPDLYVIMLLIDERPEEVTDMERQVKGPNCEVISSTFDETSQRHIQVSEIVLEKAKRMVEYGRDVLIFLDSITRLARAWNAECPVGGKIMSGGVDANALQNPKRFFGSARRVEEGGSLTIVATALVDTGSRMDQVIFEEFKGTGNMEIVLDRSLVDRRIWPAIDINASGTRREEMLRTPLEQAKITTLRRVLSELNPCDAMEALITRLSKTDSNEEFLNNIREIE